MAESRAERIKLHHQNCLGKTLRSMMEILQPDQAMRWGSYNHAQLVGYAACELALEYEAITGLPIIDILNEAGACTASDLEMPAKPEEAVQPEDALPLT